TVGNSPTSDLALARYSGRGVLDQTFGSGGLVVTDINSSDDRAAALAVQVDGKIVVAGTAGGDFALIRYQPDGSLDPGFGQGGKVTTDIEGNDVAEGLALQPDGRILVAGYSRQIPGSFVATLVRYRPDGSLDPSFGQGGKFITNFNDYLNYWTLAHAV